MLPLPTATDVFFAAGHLPERYARLRVISVQRLTYGERQDGGHR